MILLLVQTNIQSPTLSIREFFAVNIKCRLTIITIDILQNTVTKSFYYYIMLSYYYAAMSFEIVNMINSVYLIIFITGCFASVELCSFTDFWLIWLWHVLSTDQLVNMSIFWNLIWKAITDYFLEAYGNKWMIQWMVGLFLPLHSLVHQCVWKYVLCTLLLWR